MSTPKPAFVVIEIDEVEAHFALAGRRDFDQPAAEGETVDGATKHDAADQIEHDICALAADGGANLARQVLCADDHRLRDGERRRIGARLACRRR